MIFYQLVVYNSRIIFKFAMHERDLEGDRKREVGRGDKAGPLQFLNSFGCRLQNEENRPGKVDLFTSFIAPSNPKIGTIAVI